MGGTGSHEHGTDARKDTAVRIFERGNEEGTTKYDRPILLIMLLFRPKKSHKNLKPDEMRINEEQTGPRTRERASRRNRAQVLKPETVRCNLRVVSFLQKLTEFD